MRAFLATTAVALFLVMAFTAGHATAGEIPGSETPSESTTAVVEPTFDPCLEPTVGEAGEEVDPCATPTSTATIDPCEGAQTEGEEVDPCLTPSPTETVADPVPTATMTPTLEYELDVPVSFFPSETAQPGTNETVAAATEVGEEESQVTGLPNAGGAGPRDSEADWLVLIAVVMVIGSLGLVARAGRQS